MREFEENKDSLETRLQTVESEEGESRRPTSQSLHSREDFKRYNQEICSIINFKIWLHVFLLTS